MPGIVLRVRAHYKGQGGTAAAGQSWAEFAGVFARTRAAHLEHEQAKIELKGLMPDDAKEAIGHGVRAKRSKTGAVSFDLLVQEGSHAAVE
jgi:hypothetical protein